MCMFKLSLAVLCACVAAGAFGGNVVNRETVDPAIIPMPASFVTDMDRPVALDAAAKVTVFCPDAESSAWLARRFGEWFAAEAPQVVHRELPAPVEGGAEAYRLTADAAKGIEIAANTLTGVRWAAYTLRQLAIAKRGTLTTRGHLVPAMDVSDRPALAFRGIHLCWFHESRPSQIERAIRLAALCKFNYAVLESWGAYRICDHITALADFVRRRGARPMIWHDMLLEEKDVRWKGFTAYGTDETAKLADTLPKDVIICDWEYFDPADGDYTRWPTTEYFIGKGFPVVACPWRNMKSMGEHARFTASAGGYGILLTTWNDLFGEKWNKLYRNGAAAAWGTPPPIRRLLNDTAFSTALRLVGHDMKLADPLDTGNVNYQIAPSWWN